MSVSNIIHGDCLEEMRKMPDNSISAIVTDPPYGLSFMGKGWDHAVPGAEYWRECLRVTKPGGFLIAMGGTRTFHRLACAIEDAGFEIRDCVSWLYGSGFPKSHNSFGLEGYGTALKPAWEPCTIAMKACDGTFKQSAEKWGQAGINVDACRIGTESTLRPNSTASGVFVAIGREGQCNGSEKGRWPANVILDEEAGAMLDEQSGFSKSICVKTERPRGYMQMCGENSRPCHGKDIVTKIEGVNDSGGASRFFYCAKTSSRERNEGLEGLPLKQDAGCYGEFAGDGRGRQTEHRPAKNNHPTVKPLKLMEYLIKLVMPPKGGLLLDPFAGSGSTLLAAQNLGFDAIGIEKEAEYCEIARARLAHFAEKLSA